LFQQGTEQLSGVRHSSSILKIPYFAFGASATNNGRIIGCVCPAMPQQIFPEPFAAEQNTIFTDPSILLTCDSLPYRVLPVNFKT